MKVNKMIDRGKMIFFLVTFIFSYAHAKIEFLPGDISFKDADSYIELIMDEYNDPKNTTLFKIEYDGALLTLSEVTSNKFTYDIRQEGPTSYALVALSSFDYETESRPYSFKIVNKEDPQNGQVFILTINNIDDESPMISIDPCYMEENLDFTADNANCTYKLSDPDGFMDQMTFFYDFKDELKIDHKKPPNANDKESDLVVTTVQQLDYEKKLVYIFDLTVMDSQNHTVVGKVVINVIDMPDMDPIWVTSLVSQQFREKEPQHFPIQARDGDYGIDSPIKFEIKEDKDGYVHLEDENAIGTNVVNVDAIDRDKDDITEYTFQLVAYDINNVSSVAVSNVHLYLIDIDDNIPLITIQSTSTDTPVCGDTAGYEGFNFIDLDLRGGDVTIEICENFAESLPLEITISDKDTANNAQFNTKLEETDASNSYTSAFQIIPNAGYKTGPFQISVTDVAKLDYEDPDWQEISFQLVSTGLNVSMTDSANIKIKLIDYNDETPKFAKDEYKFTIPETVKKGDVIDSVPATDADAGDVITYDIVGTIAKNALNIDENGTLTVSKDNAFDYDLVQTTTFQVTATDLKNHVGSTQVTLDITDVNNKKPVIAVSEVAYVEENQMTGTALDVTIEATNTFAKADLDAHLDWEQSTVKKNFVTLDQNETMMCVDLVVTGTGSNKLSMKLVINQDLTPDFEIFDTINLFLIVENKNAEFPEAKSASATIFISVIDVNDNPPIFTPETLTANRTILENAGGGSPVGMITASDKDVTDKIEYFIESINGDAFDWIEVDKDTGALSVKPEILIDADSNQTYYLNYTITACDPKGKEDEDHRDTKEIAIYIVDQNNKKPNVDIDSEIKVVEKEPAGTEIYTITYTDEDRDEWYRTVRCDISDAACSKNFKILFIDGVNTIVVNEGANIDRDTTGDDHTCSITCVDNPSKINSDQQNDAIISSPTFNIKLLDINDHTPHIVETDFKASESLTETGVIAELEATDPDEGLNGTVTFNIIKAINDKNEDATDLFDITFDDTEENKKGKLVPKKALKDHYGIYTITVKVSDKGSPPQSDTTDLTLEITKFNFYEPRFIYPEEDTSVTLKPEQNVGQPLVVLSNDKYLPDLEASYLPKEACGDKWGFLFEIIDGDKNGAFTIAQNSKLGDCKGQLQITNKYTAENDVTYTLKLRATIKTDKEPETGEQPYTKETNLKIRFFEIGDPYFDNTELITLKVFEVDAKQTCALNTTATYGAPTDFKIYYYLVGDETTDELFEQTYDDKNIYVALKKELHYEDSANYSMVVSASKDGNEPTSKDPRSNKPIHVEVIDINNHVPQFSKESYLAAVMYQYKKDTVETATATDIDTVANKLTYILTDLETHGSNIDTIPEPFKVDIDSGAIQPSFEVKSDMDGYFTFTVTVSDEKDEYGNGPFNASVPVKILIITQENIVVFKFLNTFAEVSDNVDVMLADVTSVLEFTTLSMKIEEDTSTALIGASLYFIKGDRALLGEDVLKKISDVKVFRDLKVKLREHGLELQNFKNDPTEEDLAPVLKAWLIGVSVVLGMLCLILIVVFILKTRQLSQRISKLTNNKFGSDESNINRLGTHAPNTNLHTVEGANPVFNIEKQKEVDIASITSGDSDLIGIEDNPEFDFAHHNRDSELVNEDMFI